MSTSKSERDEMMKKLYPGSTSDELKTMTDDEVLALGKGAMIIGATFIVMVSSFTFACAGGVAYVVSTFWHLGAG